MTLAEYAKNDTGVLSEILLHIPARTYREFCKGTGLQTREVYVVSNWFNGIWVKTSKKATRVFPLQITPSEILEWEVVKKRK